MEEWSSRAEAAIDSFLIGIAIGLAISIIVAISIFVVEDFYVGKEIAAMQEQVDLEYEQQRLQLEGFVTYD